MPTYDEIQDQINRAMLAEIAEHKELRAQYVRDVAETGDMRPATRERIEAAIARLKRMDDTFARCAANRDWVKSFAESASKVEN